MWALVHQLLSAGQSGRRSDVAVSTDKTVNLMDLTWWAERNVSLPVFVRHNAFELEKLYTPVLFLEDVRIVAAQKTEQMNRKQAS